MKDILVHLRFLLRNKALSAINIFGLSMGISICICIGLYITEELSYDKYHKNIHRIFAVTTKWGTPDEMNHLATTSIALGPVLKRDYPEVEEVVRLKNLDNPTVRYGSSVFKEKEIFEADQDIFKVFTYDVLKGDPSTALAGIQSMVVTKSFGEKYFGQDDPINKTLVINNKDFQITGVIEDLPSNSDIKFSALISIDKTREQDWFSSIEFHTYILFSERYLDTRADASSFLGKLERLADENFNKTFKATNQKSRVSFLLEPLQGLHFRQPLLLDTPKGNMNYIYIIGSVALLVLVIGSLNFINFSLVQSLERRKEVAVRKILGVRYHQLVFRYLMESEMLALLAFSIALLIVSLVLPYLRNITGMNLELRQLWDLKFITAALVVILFEGILAGAYPAFFASSMKPVESLRGNVAGPKGNAFRNTSIIVQFAIAMGLVICTLLTSRQMEFISNYNLGFAQDNIIVLNTPADTLSSRQLKIFKDALLKNENIQKVSNLNYGSLPGDGGSKGEAKLRGSDKTRIVDFSRVDEDYLAALNIKLIAGRDFDSSRPHDKDVVIINESFQTAWGLTDPLNEKILWNGKEFDIIGVVKDFHFASLHSAVEPLLLFYDQSFTVNMLVLFDKNFPVSKQASLLSKEWLSMFPNEPFVYRFLNDSIASHYLNEERVIKLFTVLSSLAIVVSFLGLFGLCSLTMSQRKKEIAIRKIVGANFVSISFLFFKKYVKLIGLSFVIIAPISAIAMVRWLETFPFKENISVSIFFITFLGVVSFGLITVMLSILKTSAANPATVVRQ